MPTTPELIDERKKEWEENHNTYYAPIIKIVEGLSIERAIDILDHCKSLIQKSSTQMKVDLSLVEAP